MAQLELLDLETEIALSLQKKVVRGENVYPPPNLEIHREKVRRNRSLDCKGSKI